MSNWEDEEEEFFEGYSEDEEEADEGEWKGGESEGEPEGAGEPEGELGGLEEDAQVFVPGMTQYKQTTGIRRTTGTDYEDNFNKVASEFVANRQIDEHDIDKIKEKIFRKTDPDFRIQYKNPAAIILAYIMYIKITREKILETKAFEQTSKILKLSTMLPFFTRFTKTGEISKVTDVDIIRYYKFWQNTIQKYR